MREEDPFDERAQVVHECEEEDEGRGAGDEVIHRC